MSKSVANDNVSVHFPRVQKALARLGVLPHRTFNNVDEFKEIFSDIFELIIDVTSHHQTRPKAQNKQKETLSFPKKMHTVKNTVITTMTKLILLKGQTVTGHNHDYKILSG